jgi:hypothetical protein
MQPNSEITYRNLLSANIDNCELLLPNFQRDFVWDDDQQAYLIASFLTGLPIGSYLLVEGKKASFSYREIGSKNTHRQSENIENASEVFFLLDGQQRLTTLRIAFSDYYNIRNWIANSQITYKKLKNLWYLDLSQILADKNKSDIFGIRNLKFQPDDLFSLEPDEIRPYIVNFKVTDDVTEDMWYHPGQNFGEIDAYQQQDQWTIKIANENHIPLLGIVEKNSHLTNTLRRIADQRTQSMKIDVEEREELSLHSYFNHLQDYDTRYIDTNNTNAIDFLWNKLKDKWIESISDYFQTLIDSKALPLIVPENELGRATTIFEFMNKQGTALDTFDILVAKYAEPNDDLTLNEVLIESLNEEIIIPNSLYPFYDTYHYNPNSFKIVDNEDNITKSFKEFYLRMLGLSIKRQSLINQNQCPYDFDSNDVKYLKKNEVLKATRDIIQNQNNQILKAINRSIAFCQFRLGIPYFSDVPYKLMLLPIAYMFLDDNLWYCNRSINKLEYWYWISIFSGNYRLNQNIISLTDIKTLNEFLSTNIENTIFNDRFDNCFKERRYSDDTTLIQGGELQYQVPTSIHKTILHFVLITSKIDLLDSNISLKPWELHKNGIKLEDHHIIPLNNARTLNHSTKQLRKRTHILNSTANRLLISSKSNRAISSLSPEVYLNNWMNNFNNKATFYFPERINDAEGFVRFRHDQIKRAIMIRLNSLIEN